jgi:hypothetical protein
MVQSPEKTTEEHPLEGLYLMTKFGKRCWCGHQAKAHSPFGETEYLVGVGVKQLSSCSWCDKALAKIKIKEKAKKFYHKTKAEENAVKPHALAEKKPQWLKEKEFREGREWLDLWVLERRAQKLATTIVRGGDEPSNEQKRETWDAIQDIEDWIAGMKKALGMKV